MKSENLSPLLKEFLIEANENLALINELLPQLEKNPSDMELLNQTYRCVHTIKGGARFVKLSRLDELTHNLENLLDRIRDQKMPITAELIDVLLAGLDCMQRLVKLVEVDGTDTQFSIDETLLQISKLYDVSELVEDQLIQVLTTKPQSQARVGVRDLPAKVSVAKAVADVSPDLEKGIGDSVVRVNVSLLDKIMNVVGELVLTRNQILQYANTLDSSDLYKLSAQLNSITTEIQGDIMRTRMQPIGGILSRFERVVRDLAKDVSKKVNLRIEGRDTELDKTLLEAIKDPLTHMVRNSVDHGFETASERMAAGKSEEGLLSIKAYHEGGQITIEVKDDGRGLNKERILAKAIEKGILTKEKASQLSEKEIFNLIFMPGFSTASKVTNISGRGVGMDVVKTNIEKIGGQVDLTSEFGKGTTFKLRIPLTLAIIPALVVHDCGEAFALPQINLVELVRLEGEKLNLIEKVKGSQFFRLRGDLIPLMRLSEILKLPVSADQASSREAENIVVLNAEGRVYGLMVDSILDTQEIVVKPLSRQLKGLGYYAGATIMGDGRVALILDVMGLASHCHLQEVDSSLRKLDEVNSQKTSTDAQEVLLFKLNAKGQYAVPLVVVNRLEEFSRDQIEFVGENRVVRYREQPMPLIDLSQVFKLPKLANVQEKEIVPVFVTSFGGKYFGFVVDEIMDISISDFNVKTNSLDQEGMLGSLFIQEKTVSLVDIYWVADHLKLHGKKTSHAGLKGHAQKTILLVEDTALFRRVSENALTEIGYKVILAHDGKQAFEIFKTRHSEIDLIVSDIEMPVMNGLEFAKAVRQHPAGRNVPMLALTTRFSAKDIRLGLDSGFNSYLEKFKQQEVVEAIHNLFNRGAVA